MLKAMENHGESEENQRVDAGNPITGRTLKYSSYNLQSALDEIADGSSVSAAAKKYSISKGTLFNRLKKKHEGKQGGKLMLDPEIEQQIADWLNDCAAKGDARTKSDLLVAVRDIQNTMSSTADSKIPSKQWYKGFMKRHPEVSFRAPQAVRRAPANVSEQDIRRFFGDFHQYLTKENLHHLTSDPKRWLNCDVTGFDLNPETRKVLAAKGATSRVTVMYTFSADGHCYPPQLIMPHEFSKMEEVTRTSCNCGAGFVLFRSSERFQTRTTFEGYVKDILLPELDKRGVVRDERNRIFLFVDSHKSHTGFEFSKWCQENFVVLVAFFPSSTRILQMCDVEMFCGRKKAWVSEVSRWRSENSQELDEVEFVKILKMVNNKFIKKESIINGFRATGMYPLNVENVLFDRCIGKEYEHDPDHGHDPEHHHDPKKTLKYSSDNLQSALDEIADGSSVSAAAKKYSISKGTLFNRLYEKHEGKQGGKQMLDPEVEQQIANWLIDCAAKGDPRTKFDLLMAVQDVQKTMSSTADSKIPSKQWYKGFIKRHPEVSFRTPKEVARALANVSEQDIRRFFGDFHQYLTKENLHHLTSDPKRWLNCDVTGFDLNPETRKVLAAKGATSRVTVMYTFSADGHCYPPQLIMPREFSKMEEVTRTSRNCGAGFVLFRSSERFQTRTTFEGYVKDILLPELDKRGVVRNERNRIFLFVDSHKSHTGFEFSKWCQENFVVLVAFFPSSTRILQMCDVEMFCGRKKAWVSEVSRWRSENNQKLDEVEFVKILKLVNDKCIKKEPIINGFRATGIFPLNVENMLFDRFSVPLRTPEAEDQVEAPLSVFDAEHELDKLRELDELEEIDELQEIDELEELDELQEIDELEKIEELQEIDELEELDGRSSTDESGPLFLKIKYLLNTLKSHVAVANPQLSGYVDIAEHALSMAETSIRGNKQVTLTSAYELPSPSSNCSGSPSFTEALKPPQTFKRSEKRPNLKLTNNGVMTDDINGDSETEPGPRKNPGRSAKKRKCW